MSALHNKSRLAATGLFASLLLSACVTGTGNDVTSGSLDDDLLPPGLGASAGPSDPLEDVNRAIFGFNQQIDRFLIEPIAVTYVELTPEPVREGVTNALRNLGLPLSAIHSLLQGKFGEAGHTAERFVTNSVTLWLDDLHRDQPYPEEDAGQTLAVAGIGDGPYLVLPLLGPSNVRDAFGRLIDTVIDPVGIFIGPTGGLARAAVDGVDTRARLGPTIDELESTSLDFYATVRSLYNQNRQSQIRDGEIDPLHSAASTIVVELGDDFGAAAGSDFGGTIESDFGNAIEDDFAAGAKVAIVDPVADPVIDPAGADARLTELTPVSGPTVIEAEILPIPTASAANVDSATLIDQGNSQIGELQSAPDDLPVDPTISELKKLGIDVDLVHAPRR